MADDYSRTDKLLHRLALGKSVAELSFEIETKIHSQNLPASKDSKHIFITGLARSGTTILMRSLFESSELCSLTYEDMPFILAPNSWTKAASLSKKKHVEKERSHKDGINVSFSSPEAFEEVFWRVFSEEKYIQKQYLTTMEADEGLIEKFRQFISLILLRYKKSRYLSKNNNNILRVGSIKNAFPNSHILIPFRDPIQQSYSLYKQHQLFQEKHTSDKFSKQYMQWLVHHEFGGDHRPFTFGRKNTVETSGVENINYWVQQWINAYQHLLERYRKSQSQIVFLSYDILCDKKEKLWPKLIADLDLSDTIQNIPNLKARQYDINLHIEPTLIKQARGIHKTLVELTHYI